jgi:hypothetical protein
MTSDQLQAVVLRLANQIPVRYWTHWNHPRADPWRMAVKVYDGGRFGRGKGLDRYVQVHRDMLGLGGVWDGKAQLWTFDRTNEDGTPYRGPTQGDA